MPGNAFTGGVKPGGLTNSTEIRILLCYLVDNAPSPLSQAELEGALLGEELVNYFELANALAELCAQGLLEKLEDQRFRILPPGKEVAVTLKNDVPRSVRDAASRAVILAQQFARNAAQHHADIVPCGGGYTLRCSIADLDSEVFSFSVYMPDKETARLAREQFVENGADIYKLMLAALTGKDELIHDILKDVTI